MSQDNLIAAAQQAHPKALSILLANLLKRSLQPHDIQVRVQRQGAELKIFLEGERLPDQTAVGDCILRSLHRLDIQSVQSVTLYAYVTGSTLPGWTQTIPLRACAASSPPGSPRSSPWRQVRVRNIFAWAILFSVLISLGLLPLTWLIGLSQNDPISGALLGLAFYGLMYLWALGQFKILSINHQRVIGNLPKGYLWWWRPLGLVAAMILFSLGSFQLAFYGISFWFPDFLESILNRALLFSANDTAHLWLTNWLQVVMVVVAAPVVEEFLFRGMILHRWAEKWGPRRALWSSALLFGVLHANFVGLTMFGLVMGLLYLRTRTLIVPIVCHALNNAIALSFHFLAVDSSDASLTLEQFRAGWRVGLVYLVITLPWLIRFIGENWPQPDAQLPYRMNVGQAQNRLAAFNVSLAKLSLAPVRKSRE